MIILAIGIEAYIGKQQKALAKKKALNASLAAEEKSPASLLNGNQTKKLA
jgi:hypothetical protein